MFSIKKSVYIIIAIFLLSSFFLAVFLSGCSKPECKIDEDCPSSKCREYTCIKKECVATIKSNCCGNGECESTASYKESKCTCATDCGSCPEKSNSTYLAYFCSPEEDCVTAVDASKVKQQSHMNKFSIGNSVTVAVQYLIDEPFNVDSSAVKAKFRLEAIPQTVSKAKIVRLSVIEKAANNEKKLLGEKVINKFLYDITGEVSDEIILIFPMESEEEKKNILIKLDTENYVIASGVERATPSSSEMALTTAQLTFVNPSKMPSCPASCNDNNPCTYDYCDASTYYFCSHSIGQGSCCGNSVCNSDEDPCSCVQDCGRCERIYGAYIEYSCVSKQCVSSLKSSQSIQPLTKTQESKIGESNTGFTVTYDVPFDVRSSTFDVSIELLDKPAAIASIKCTKIQVLNDKELLVEKDIENALTSVGQSFKKSIEPSFAMRDVEEEKKAVTIKLTCSQDKIEAAGMRTTIVSASFNLGSITFINPEA